VLVQEPCEASCAMAPAVVKPAMEALASSTVKDRFTIVMLPERAAPLVAAAWKLMVPLPTPVPTPEMEIQLALLATVQAHPVPVVIVIVPLPPAAANACPPGPME
jgi:hypothetical protein